MTDNLGHRTFCIEEGPKMGRKKSTLETSETQQKLIDSALDVFGNKGIDGATVRAIADHAGVNQSLIFYHFGSVPELIIAAVEQMSNARFVVYKEELLKAKTVQDLIEILFEVFEEDKAGTCYPVLNQFIAASQNDEMMAAKAEPIFSKWLELAKESMTNVMGDVTLPNDMTLDDIAFGVISLFLGIQLMNSVNGYETKVDSLLNHARQATPMINMVMTMFGTKN